MFYINLLPNALEPPLYGQSDPYIYIHENLFDTIYLINYIINFQSENKIC